MSSVSLFVLGGFIGYIIIYALLAAKDWSNPVTTLTGVIGAAVAGGLFTLLERLAVTPIGDAVYFYPIGLGYGGLCRGLTWLMEGKVSAIKKVHIAAFGLATLVIAGLIFSPAMRAILPA